MKAIHRSLVNVYPFLVSPLVFQIITPTIPAQFPP